MAKNGKLTWQEKYLLPAAIEVGGRLVKLMLGTCRVELVNQAIDRDFFDRDINFIGVTWHRSAIFSLRYYEGRDMAIMISRSKDGDLLARYLRLMGGTPVRGSSSRGGAEALLAMTKFLTEKPGRYAATVADGPNGPRYKAKPGMIYLAMRTGLPLVPLMWSAERMWCFRKAWDRTIIPKPFSKVYVDYGEPIYYPEAMSDEEMETARRHLEEQLNILRDRVDKLAGWQDPD